MARRYATGKERLAFAKALDDAQVSLAVVKHEKVPFLVTDGADPLQFVMVKVRVQVEDKTFVCTVDTTYRDMWTRACHLFSEDLVPSSLKVKATKVAFTGLRGRIAELTAVERAKKDPDTVRRSLNADFRKRDKAKREYAFSVAKDRFHDLLEEGFAGITEQELVDTFRQFQIEKVMDA